MLENLLSCGLNREYITHSKLVSQLLVLLTFYEIQVRKSCALKMPSQT